MSSVQTILGPPMADIDQIAEVLCGVLRRQWGLRAPQVHHKINPFGFTLVTLSVSDGPSRLHVKLAPRGRQSGLRKWLRHEATLHGRYRAPNIRGWVSLPGTGYAGLVFDHLPGRNPGPLAMRSVAPKLARLLDRLHHDAPLARALRGTQRREPDAAVMIREGVQVACDRPPPFVRRADALWVRNQGEANLRALRDIRTGWKPCAIHGDMWAGNLMVQGRNWWVIDWDELALGDPAGDWSAMALMADPRGDFERGIRRLATMPDAATMARARVHHRALVLSWVVDVLADWHEAVALGAHARRVRATKQVLYERWLGVYRRWYG